MLKLLMQHEHDALQDDMASPSSSFEGSFHSAVGPQRSFCSDGDDRPEDVCDEENSADFDQDSSGPTEEQKGPTFWLPWILEADPLSVDVAEKIEWTGPRDRKPHFVFPIRVGHVFRYVRSSLLKKWREQPQFKNLQYDSPTELRTFLQSLEQNQRTAFRKLSQQVELPHETNRVWGFEPAVTMAPVKVDQDQSKDYTEYKMDVEIPVWKMDVGDNAEAQSKMDYGRNFLGLARHAHEETTDTLQIVVRHSELKTLVYSISSKVPALATLKNKFWNVDSDSCGAWFKRGFAHVKRWCKGSKGDDVQQRKVHMENTVKEILENRHLFDEDLYMEMCNCFAAESDNKFQAEQRAKEFKYFLKGHHDLYKLQTNNLHE